MLSSWSYWVDQATEAVKELSDQATEAVKDLSDQAAEVVKDFSEQSAEAIRQTGILESLEEHLVLGGEEDAVSSSTDQKQPTIIVLTKEDVSASPPVWSSSAEEWDVLVHAAWCCRASCTVPPTQYCEDATVWHDICELLKLADSDAAAAVATSSAAYEPDAALVEWIVAHPDIHAFRSMVVPLAVSDEAYWCHMGWRMRMCALCKDASQLLSLLSLLSMQHATVPSCTEENQNIGESGEEPAAAAAPVWEHDEETQAHWAKTEQTWSTLYEKNKWIDQIKKEAEAEISHALGNAKLLRGLATKKDTQSGLAESVYESCGFHKTKLSRIVRDVDQQQAQLTGTTLSDQGGVLYRKLADAQGEVQAALDMFLLAEGDHQPSAPQEQGGEEEGDHLDREEGSRRDFSLSGSHAKENSAERNDESHSSLRRSVSVADDDDAAAAIDPLCEDTAFEAVLPWDE